MKYEKDSTNYCNSIVIILFSICGLFITQKTTIRNIKKYNSQYEYYINKKAYMAQN